MKTDTLPDARAMQRAIHRRMDGSRRVALMFEMSEEARAITLAGLRRQYPELDLRDLVRLERIRRLGKDLTAAAWPEP